jgi:hypothetical protein
MCMYIFMYVCAHVDKVVHISARRTLIGLDMYVCIYGSDMYVCMYVCMYVLICVNTHSSTYNVCTYIYTCARTHMYVRVYTYIHATQHHVYSVHLICVFLSGIVLSFASFWSDHCGRSGTYVSCMYVSMCVSMYVCMYVCM